MEKTTLISPKKALLLKIFSAVFGIFGSLVIIHRLSYYVYEYDPQFSPVDHGKFNILSFFTVQSNIFVCIYLLIIFLALMGVKKLEKIAFNEYLGTLITTYILLTGLIYCCGIPLGFTPPYTWDTPNHAMLSFIQVFHHMIVPPLMVILWLCPMTGKKVKYKSLWIAGIYPLLYSLFSIIRGAVTGYYVYPFYNVQFIWDLFFKGKEMSPFSGYLLMLPVLALGIGLFIGVAVLLAFLHNKFVEKKIKLYKEEMVV